MKKRNRYWKAAFRAIGHSAFVLSCVAAGAGGAVAKTAPQQIELRPVNIDFIGGIAISKRIPAPALFGASLANQFAIAFPFSPDDNDEPEQQAIDPIITAAIVPGVFGSMAMPMHNFPVSARWSPIYRAIQDCANGAVCAKGAASFERAVEMAKGKPLLEKLAIVNSAINRNIAYRSDRKIYGKLDHWARPVDILKHGKGDCEDYVILKMAALLKAGVPANSMSFVVLQDTGRGVFHAVLSVSTVDGAFILDNNFSKVVRDRALPSYLPLYSFSTNRAWIHGSKQGEARVAGLDSDLKSVAPGEGPGTDNEATLPVPDILSDQWHLRF